MHQAKHQDTPRALITRRSQVRIPPPLLEKALETQGFLRLSELDGRRLPVGISCRNSRLRGPSPANGFLPRAPLPVISIKLTCVDRESVRRCSELNGGPRVTLAAGPNRRLRRWSCHGCVEGLRRRAGVPALRGLCVQRIRRWLLSVRSCSTTVRIYARSLPAEVARLPVQTSSGWRIADRGWIAGARGRTAAGAGPAGSAAAHRGVDGGALENSARSWGHRSRNVSKHLLVLYRAGVLSRRPEGPNVFYSLADGSARAVLDEMLASVNRQLRELSDLATKPPEES